MTFEFDPAKSAANREKHGIDFVEAQTLWLDERAVEFRARVMEEERFVVIGQIDGKVWTAVVTYREEKVRIISVRRSRAKEVLGYESQ